MYLLNLDNLKRDLLQQKVYGSLEVWKDVAHFQAGEGW